MGERKETDEMGRGIEGEPPAGLPVADNPETRQTEGEKLKGHIRSIVEKFDFLDCLKKGKRELSDEQGERIKALIWKGKETIIQQIISYLFGEYGEESVKNLISKNTFPELELFKDELHDIAVSYYDTIFETGKKSAEAASADTEGANLEKYPNGVLDGAAEALLKFAEQEELEKEIEAAVETRIQEILKAINDLDRENLQKSGVDLRKLDEELKETQKEGKAKIIKHCLNSFQAGGALKTKIRDREKIKFWTDYYTESFFEYRGGDDLRAAYLKAFPERSKVFREVSRDKKVEPAETIPAERILGESGTVAPDITHLKDEEIVRTKVDKDIFGPPVNPKDGTEDTTPERAIAWHALASPQTGEFRNLVGEGLSKKESEELFKKKITELLKDFTTHGMLGKPDLKTGERPLLSRSDLDGQACIILLKKAGFNLSKIKYVRQGKEPESGWAFDTMKEHGYIIRDGGKILITNDSNKESRKDSSAKFIFDGLVKFGLLDTKKHPGIRKFVEFVTKEDNKNYTDEEARQIIAHYSKNLMGLRRFLTDEDLVRIFEEQTMESSDFSPYHQLPVSYLKKLSYIDGLSFENVMKRLADSKKYSLEAIKNLAEQGFTIDTGERFGRVLIDTGQKDAQGIHRRKVGLGFDAARHEGYGAYVVFDEESGYFSVQTMKEMDFDFSQGFAVGKHYWLFTGKDAGGKDEKLATSLEEILKKLSGDPDYRMESSLKAALENERKENEKTEKKMSLLFEGLKVSEIEAEMTGDISSLSGEERKKIEEKFKILEEVKTLIRKTAGTASFSEKEIEYFLGSVLGKKNFEQYASLRDKEADPGKRERFGSMVKRVTRDFLEKRGYNKDEAKQVVKLFFKMTELKFIK